MIKVLWAVFATSMVIGFIFVPDQLPGESTTHYLLADHTERWEYFASLIIASVAGALLLMNYLTKHRA